MRTAAFVMFVVVPPLVLSSARAQLPPTFSASRIDYEKDVKPLLARNCYGCHGPEVQEAGLRLDLRQNALRGGDHGPVIIPGKSAESELIRRLVDRDGGLQMPPTGALSPEEVGVLRAWIDQGADFRNDTAEEAGPKPIDPKLGALIPTARSGTADQLRRLLAASPDLVNATDAAGSTLLHHAAAFGTAETMMLLLDSGANPNSKNSLGSTPLHWAITSEVKVRLLLSRGGQVNVKQAEGRTPLYQAATVERAVPTVRLLLEHDADPNLATTNGRTPLMAASLRGDVEVMRLLLEAKAQIDARTGAGETALVFAASAANADAVRLLLERGADARAITNRNETALGNAATAGNAEVVRMLLDRGAEVNIRNLRGYSPLMFAASSDTIPTAVVRMLLDKGADTSFTADFDESARDLALKRGNTQVARLLGGSIVPPAAASHVIAAPTRSTAEAASLALEMTAKQSHNFIRIAGCNSCHSQDLPSAAIAYARSRGVPTPASFPQLPQSRMPSPERLMDFSAFALPGSAWELFDLGMNNVPKSAYSDAVVRAIMAMQTAAGNWSAPESRRSVLNAGEMQAAAVCVYALIHYAPDGQDGQAAAAIRRAVAWLERARPATTQDKVFHALALLWAGAKESARRSAKTLLALQHSDGGWSQLPTIESDAYASGQALFALAVTGAVVTSDNTFQKGVGYLLRTQAADGTWHVKTRAIWLQPYFESGFPYGRDQFISTAGTAWAAMALAAATPAPMPTLQRNDAGHGKH
jgi:ankyrin repeat protein